MSGSVGNSRLGSILGIVAGFWLVVGPFVYPVWSGAVAPHATADWKRMLLWLGWYVGTGALIATLSGIALGLLSRRPLAVPFVVGDAAAPAAPAVDTVAPEAPADTDPVVERTRV
jgi:hypothetical protein